MIYTQFVVLTVGSCTYWVLENIVVYIKVGGVGGRGHVGDVGGFSRPDVVPVDASKEWVALEV